MKNVGLLNSPKQEDSTTSLVVISGKDDPERDIGKFIHSLLVDFKYMYSWNKSARTQPFAKRGSPG